MTTLSEHQNFTTEKFANLRLSERTHPLLSANPDMLVTILDLRLCGFYEERQWATTITSERSLAKRMAEVCGGSERCHRERLQKLKKFGLYTFVDGTVSIHLDGGTSKVDAGTAKVDGTTSEMDGEASKMDGTTSTERRKSPGQTAKIGPTNSKNSRTVRTAEQAADAAGAEEGVKMATLGADPDRTWSDRRPAKPWRKSKTREPETRHESRTNQYPANCSRCGKNLPAGQGEYLGKDAEGKPLVKCLTRCEDILGKKAKREAHRKLLQAQIESIALAQDNEKFRNALFDLKAALDTKQHLYDTYDELAEASYPHIEAWFGADAYQFAYETLKEFYA